MTAYVTDLALSRRLEYAEARANAASVDAHARFDPACGATWRDVGGTYAMYDGPASPITQTFGLGMTATPTDDELATLEAFFRERGAEVFHEVSPLVEPSLVVRLGDRGYRPAELTAVLHQPIVAGANAEPAAAPSAPRARAIGPDEAALWGETAARGWETEGAWVGEFMRAYGRMLTTAAGAVCFVAEAGGEPVAAGALMMHGGVAILGGASTVPAWRAPAAQAALLRARLRHAAIIARSHPDAAALPGSASQRNAERQGFRIAYTRIKWRLHDR